MSRRIFRAALATIVAALTLSAQPAAAAPVDLTCPFATTIGFTPGVSLIPKPIGMSGPIAVGTSAIPLIPCSSLTGAPYTSAVGSITGSGTVACVTLGNGLVGTVSGTMNLTWNNGETSTISFTLTSVGPVPVVTGTVTGGALQGFSMAVVAGPTGFTGNCVLTPVTSLSFAGALVFLDL
jgi:hypothetical protein